MNCLCCGKAIDPGEEKLAGSGWHSRCVRSFFHTDRFPEVKLDEVSLLHLAEESARQGYTVAGVQKKLSLHLSVFRNAPPRLTLVDYPAGYILKPQTKEFPHLPEAEHLTMSMAETAGIQVVPHALMFQGGEEGKLAYITRRVDRGIRTGRNPETELYAMEDFCQLSERMTEDKYKGSYERCAGIIRNYSIWPGIDLTEFWLRVVFCWLTGNSDMHLKNFSLLETAPGSRKFRLSPAYDLLPVSLLLPEDPEETALTLNGKKARLRRRDFIALAERCGIPEKTAYKLISRMCSREEQMQGQIEESLLPDRMKESYREFLSGRMRLLQQ